MGCCLSACIPTRDLRKFEAVEGRRDFSFDGKTVTAIVPADGVYDGDTCRIIFKCDGRIYQWKIRCLGYDSPEMKPPLNQPDRDDEIVRAKAARDAFLSCVRDRKLKVKLGPFDMYGRIVAEVFVDGNSMTQWMISRGFGVPMGKTRPKRSLPSVPASASGAAVDEESSSEGSGSVSAARGGPQVAKVVSRR